MSKHTPGPWHVEPVGYPERAHPEVYAGKKRVAQPCNSRDVPSPESNYNARLIAAAPDLLAACRAAYEWIGRFGEHAPIVFGGEAELSEQLHAAIEKAGQP